MKKIVTIAAFALLLSACGSASSGSDATAEQVEKAIAAAEQARQDAAAVDFEWRDTGKMLDQARKAMEKGDYDKALGLAKEAEKQGHLAVKQAEDQADASATLQVN